MIKVHSKKTVSSWPVGIEKEVVFELNEHAMQEAVRALRVLDSYTNRARKELDMRFGVADLEQIEYEFKDGKYLKIKITQGANG